MFEIANILKIISFSETEFKDPERYALKLYETLMLNRLHFKGILEWLSSTWLLNLSNIEIIKNLFICKSVS
ncbi:hypothetical protein CBW18_17405 [Pedobacter sp. AJM]|nr:hypothetical protein CBW18_17405 [Pedobacter sp. AJM]